MWYIVFAKNLVSLFTFQNLGFRVDCCLLLEAFLQGYVGPPMLDGMEFTGIYPGDNSTLLALFLSFEIDVAVANSDGNKSPDSNCLISPSL